MPGGPAVAATDLPIGSLFSGVGGLDLGVQAALGGHIAWHAESDPHAAQVLARHWQVPNLGDVRAVDWHRIEPVCVLTAGFPCQDLSVAGPRTGLATGTRSGLWHHVAHAINVLNPCLVVIENVRGILSTRTPTKTVRDVEPCSRHLGDRPGLPGMRALGVVLGDLADLGYDTTWTCVRACDVGAPHQRARIFLTARPASQDPDGQPRCQRRLPAPRETQGRRARPEPRRRGRAPAPDAPRERRHEGLPEPALPQRHPHPRLHRRGTLTGADNRHGRCEIGGAAASHPYLSRRQRRSGHHPQASGRNESAHRCLSPAGWWGDYLPAIRRWEHATGRAAPSPTVPGTRRLSAEFVEWMMLPSGWVTETEGLSRAAQLRLLGNSVVPEQAALALTLLLADGNPGDGRPRRYGTSLGGGR
ncbi:DNA (cytosine-5-)-methyltransferase [Streptomyces sp. NPDC004237]|uniref:DNA cytosine methyltransferase n=1 Tax=Streptomyces sp. NPDC004237 TaxID=3154455 RepID=UPI0033A80454